MFYRGGGMKKTFYTLLIALVILSSFFSGSNQVQAQEEKPVIRAVLFYSPSCPHCLDVINDVLPPLVEEYGTQLQIFGVDTYTEQGGRLFDQAMNQFQVPAENRGVPAMLVDDQLLLGSREIPEKFPGIIQEGLQQGGIDWPDLPGLTEARAAAEQSAADPEGGLNHRTTLRERFTADLAANSLSVLVLIGMLAAVIGVGINLRKPVNPGSSGQSGWLIPVLAVIGTGVAAYLAYVEFSRTEAVCGPVGKCNTVQQSPYAYLFGVIPMGFLGVLGYLAVLIAWVLQSYGPERWQKASSFALWGVTLFGTLFSIYLTFLEPFVIGASCLWCLGSAVIMTLLFILATRDAKQAQVFQRT